MLDRFLESPMLPIGFIAFVLILAAYYLVNRERSHVQRLKGPRRFQPEWSRKDGRRRRRRRSRVGGEFKPGWTRTKREPPSEGEDRPSDSAPPEADPDH